MDSYLGFGVISGQGRTDQTEAVVLPRAAIRRPFPTEYARPETAAARRWRGSGTRVAPSDQEAGYR